jgi:hypothetical protein
MLDNVYSPAHYAGDGMQVIDAIKAFFGEREYVGFLWGNVVKYVLRYRKKGGVEDLEKARWYLNKLIVAESTVDADDVHVP